MHIAEEKNKSILFTSKRKIKYARKLNVKYKSIKIKKHLQVTYLGYVLDETLCGEPMTLKALNKINGKLKFLCRKNNIFNTSTMQNAIQCYYAPAF